MYFTHPVYISLFAFILGAGLFVLGVIAFSVSVSGSDLVFHAIKSGLSFVVVALPPSLVIWYYRKRYF